MKNLLFFFFALALSCPGFAQSTNNTVLTNSDLFVSDYPAGIYKTKEDFQKKLPSDTAQVIPKNLPGKKKDSLILNQNTFFYTVATDKKVKNVFAISYRGYIFFNVQSILLNRNKTDRSQTNSNPNAFVGVMYAGNNYLYTEANLANAWAQGFAYGMGGAVGGAVAQTMVYGKGILWDFKNSEFNILKNCKDYNDFIKEKYPEGVQECKNNSPDMLKVRKDIKNVL